MYVCRYVYVYIYLDIYKLYICNHENNIYNIYTLH